MLVSSHLLSEVQQVADRLVVIGRGRLIADATTQDILRGLGHGRVRVRSPRADELVTRLRDGGMTAERTGADGLVVTDGAARRIGETAIAARIPLHQLPEETQSLGEAYLALTGGSDEFTDRRAEPATQAAR